MSDPVIVTAQLSPGFGIDAGINLLREALSTLVPVRIVPLVPRVRPAHDVRGGQVRAGSAEPLDDFFRIESPTPEHAKAVLSILRGTPGVKTVYIEPKYSLPMCPPPSGGVAAPPTPDYVPLQRCLGPAPDGIDAQFAWSKGATGSGVALADIEEGWLIDHEDFNPARIALQHGQINPDPPWIDHGTACVGEAFARANSVGVTGIARGAKMVHCCSIFGQDNSAALAIMRATDLLSAGDVLLIELQADAPDTALPIPIEFFEANFVAIERATLREITVVAAAANGEDDLDSPIYGGAFSRAVRDSHAILVGAGGAAPGSPLARCRLPFSNYGSRIDLQGYGEQVCTTGYGDLFGIALGLQNTRWYTAAFNGTSSAAAMVWGACAVIQSYVKKKFRRHLTPLELRDLLVATGSPQQDHADSPVANHIGPLPNLRGAIEQITERLNPRQRRSRGPGP